jgi:CDP-diacylglycerol--serine O-phosphatidyltransferase
LGARRRRRSARELDSLADVISFGTSPATLAFGVRDDGRLGRGHLRLLRLLRRPRAWRTLQRHRRSSLSGACGKVTYFEGAADSRPACCSTALLAWAIWQGRIGANLVGGAWTLLGADLAPVRACSSTLVGNAHDQQDDCASPSF